MEAARKVLAVIVGILILVIVVFAARFIGQKIQQRIFTPKTVVTENLPVVPVQTSPSLITKNNIATISAIPKTGPEDIGFVVMGLMFFGGISSLTLSKRFS